VSQNVDQHLILQLQSGDLNALGALFDRHRHLVYRTALAITNDSEVASDLLQDVFLRIHRFSHKIDTERPLEPWLYRVTTNLAYSWMKRRNRLTRYLREIAELLSREQKPTPHHMAERDEEWRWVQQAVANLPLAQRVVVVLYYVNDLSLQEISEILDIPAGTVKSRLHYGRKALKKHLVLQRERLAEVYFEFSS
jgi:RNA polymerase sigma-70 factor (ECF subfamily)